MDRGALDPYMNAKRRPLIWGQSGPGLECYSFPSRNSASRSMYQQVGARTRLCDCMSQKSNDLMGISPLGLNNGAAI